MELRQMIRLYEVKLKPGQKEDCLNEVVFSKLGLKSSKDAEIISDIKVSGRSVDARDKKNIHIVYNVDFSVKKTTEVKFINTIKKKNKKLKIAILSEKKYNPVQNTNINKSAKKQKDKSEFRPVIAGFGPAGMFAALYFIHNDVRPIVIERGKSIEERVSDVKDFWTRGIFNPESNPLFGEGGAGTFSDGKLTTGKNDTRIPFILHEFYHAGAPEEILYAKNPHIGTDVLRTVVENIRKKILDSGGEIRFETKLTRINVSNNTNGTDSYHESGLNSIEIKDSSGKLEELPATHLILATGHSARDTYKDLLEQGLSMEQKPFSIGLRIQHEQNIINNAQYGNDFESIYNMTLAEAEMPPAEYKLAHRLDNGRGVYTFCMCPGGEIITLAAEKETVSVNGMSEQARDGRFANSALLVDVRTDDYESDHPLAGIDFQREYEKRAYAAGGSKYNPPKEKVGEFLNESGNSKLAGCLPEFAVKGIREAIPVFAGKIKGFDDSDAIVKGIESGSSSPVRITRDKNFVGSIDGVYPCGEGAGYAGGITSSAIDGLKCAEAALSNFSLNE